MLSHGSTSLQLLCVVHQARQRVPYDACVRVFYGQKVIELRNMTVMRDKMMRVHVGYIYRAFNERRSRLDVP